MSLPVKEETVHYPSRHYRFGDLLGWRQHPVRPVNDLLMYPKVPGALSVQVIARYCTYCKEPMTWNEYMYEHNPMECGADVTPPRPWASARPDVEIVAVVLAFLAILTFTATLVLIFADVVGII